MPNEGGNRPSSSHRCRLSLAEPRASGSRWSIPFTRRFTDSDSIFFIFPRKSSATPSEDEDEDVPTAAAPPDPPAAANPSAPPPETDDDEAPLPLLAAATADGGAAAADDAEEAARYLRSDGRSSTALPRNTSATTHPRLNMSMALVSGPSLPMRPPRASAFPCLPLPPPPPLAEYPPAPSDDDDDDDDASEEEAEESDAATAADEDDDEEEPFCAALVPASRLPNLPSISDSAEDE